MSNNMGDQQYDDALLQEPDLEPDEFPYETDEFPNDPNEPIIWGTNKRRTRYTEEAVID